MARNADHAKQSGSSDDAPWWHEDVSEFAGDDSDATNSNSDETNELLNTATQEAVQLASTLSTWAEKTGFTPILRTVAQQAMDTAQDAAGSLMNSSDSTDEPTRASDIEVDLADHLVSDDELDAELSTIDLDSDDFRHLDEDPAVAGAVQFNSSASNGLGEHKLHQSMRGGEVRVTCDYCPVCRVIESLDDLNPETAAAIAEVMAVVTDGIASAVMDLVFKSADQDDADQ